MIKLKFYGLGGQGVVTAAKIFSTAVSLYEDKYAVIIPAYGHERRGAPVNTSIITDKEMVLLNSFVYDPDIVLVMDHNIIDKNVDISEGINENSILVLNTGDLEVLKRYEEYEFKEIYHVDGTRVAIENIGRGIPNSSMLGALAATGIVGIDSIKSAIRDSFKSKAGEMNAKAAAKAYEQCKKI